MATAHMSPDFFDTVAHHLPPEQPVGLKGGALLRWLGIEPHIARQRTPHGSGLGKVRWVVERTISRLKGLRRLRVRYDRLGAIMGAWATLAAGVILNRASPQWNRCHLTDTSRQGLR